MPNPSLYVHDILVHFVGGTDPERFQPEEIHMLQVRRQVLQVWAAPEPELLERMSRLGERADALVSAVEFHYHAGDQKHYRTVVNAGQGDAAADHIIFRSPGPVIVTPRPPKVFAAETIVPGTTYSVREHDTEAAASMSATLQVGWHRRDCTWFYPY